MTRIDLLAFGMCVTIVFTACYRPSVREVVSPDGHTAYVVECRRAGDCMELAGEKCPGGYVPIDGDQRTESGAFYSAGGANAFGSAYSATTTTVMIRCRDQPPEVKKPSRCGYTCAPQPRECPWLDDNGCYKAGYDVPQQ